MTNEPPFTLVDPQEARAAAQRLFETVKGALREVLPTADIRHIGSTAIPGCLTKGDLDIAVRVPVDAFPAAEAALARMYVRNDGSIRTATFSAFEDGASDPHLGIQLAAIDGPSDFFHLFVEALLSDPELVEEYNKLKRAHAGQAMAAYRTAKDEFIESVLAQRRATKSGD